MRKPQRIFRERRTPVEPHDRRRVEYRAERVVDPPDLLAAIDVTKHLVYVPVHRFVDTDTYSCLRGLEDMGVIVHYSKGASAIDLSRSVLASEALKEGYESILFIDSDMLFDPRDALRFLASPEPVLAGVYAAKMMGKGQLNVDFGPGAPPVPFGEEIGGLRSVPKVGAGFLRIKTDFLRRMIKELDLPYCRMASTFGWPFFMPMVVNEDHGPKYLPEDYAFSRRCCDIGTPIKVDTRFRLYHLGEYAYGLEEGEGRYIPRVMNKIVEMDRPPAAPFTAPEI